jgi:hypothetical protein
MLVLRAICARADRRASAFGHLLSWLLLAVASCGIAHAQTLPAIVLGLTTQSRLSLGPDALSAEFQGVWTPDTGVIRYRAAKDCVAFCGRTSKYLRAGAVRDSRTTYAYVYGYGSIAPPPTGGERSTGNGIEVIDSRDGSVVASHSDGDTQGIFDMKLVMLTSERAIIGLAAYPGTVPVLARYALPALTRTWQQYLPASDVDHGRAATPLVSRDGQRLYVLLDGTLYTADPGTGALTKRLSLPSAFALALDDSGNRLYVADDRGIDVYDASTFLPAAHVSADTDYRDFAMYPTPAGRLVYDVDPTHVVAFDPVTGTSTSHVLAAGRTVQRSEDGRWLYRIIPGTCTQYVETDFRCGSDHLAMLDAATLRAVRDVAIDARPDDDPTNALRYAITWIADGPQVNDVVEYYHAALGHYFMTASPGEIALLDAGAFSGWARTGETFPAMTAGATAGDVVTPVCRYFGRPGSGVNSHFYSASPVECDEVAARFGDEWELETPEAFVVYPADAATGACPAGTAAVYRLYNQRADPNHRYTTSVLVRAQMIGEDWVPEGYGPDAIAFCVPGH